MASEPKVGKVYYLLVRFGRQVRAKCATCQRYLSVRDGQATCLFCKSHWSQTSREGYYRLESSK